MQVTCFHNPDEENGYLSNWYPSRFACDGVAYSSMEQFMMHRKALLFGDERVASLLLSSEDPAGIKRLGREVSGYDDTTWNGARQIVVYEGLLAKLSQNGDLLNRLLATGDDALAECAVKDRIWGIGLSMDDPRRFNKSQWKGQNLLGYALMMARDSLSKSGKGMASSVLADRCD